MLLVNSTDPSSLEIANKYIELRELPESNVVHIPLRMKPDTTSGSAFSKRILEPALQAMKERGLTAQIDYLVYSSGFPYRVAFAADFPGEKFPQQTPPRGSLTGLTYLYKFVEAKRKEVVSLGSNFYFLDSAHGITVSRAFRSQYRWAPGGRRTGAAGLGYMISSMLGSTYGRGNTVAEIIHCLQQAKLADGTKPPGTVYFMKHGGVRSTARDKNFESAATELRRLGVAAKVEEGRFPQNKPSIAGLTTGIVSTDLKRSGCRFLPGAFCDNLTSSGGVLALPNPLIDPKTGKRRKGQICVSEFIRFGATAASGTVYEPLAIPHKFPHPSIHVHYAQGCSMGEAFYQSVSGPYQQLLMGDPLCQPWAEFPEVKVPDLASGAMLEGDVSLKPEAKKEGAGIRDFSLFVDGRRVETCPPGGTLQLDTTKFRSGIHELRVVARDDSPIETQGRWIAEVWFKNGNNAIDLTATQNRVSVSAPTFAVTVRSSSPAKVEIYCNSRKLGEVADGSGVVQVDPKVLGVGNVKLVALSDQVRSRPLLLEITQ